MTTTLTMLDAALQYASRGWAIFPLRPGEKIPLPGSRGVKDATTDEPTVSRWWRETPNANIGLSCGASGILAVDIDVKNGKTGLATWARLAGALGIPENGTLASLTPTGGRHLLYRMPQTSLGNTTGKLGDGLDTRGDGGYIVVSPSAIGGKAYRWEAPEVQPVPCPPPLVERLTHDPPRDDPHPWAGQRRELADLLARAPEPTRWIVPGVLEGGILAFVYGGPGSLKSMLVADMALSVAAGRPWLTGGLLVAPVPVVWCDLDNGGRRTHERFRALAHGHGITEAALTVFLFPNLDLGDPGSVVALRDAITETGAGLVVVDTFLNSTTVENENDNAQIRDPLGALRLLVETTGATIIPIHHVSKATAAGAHHLDLRGAGAIAGAADLLLRVVRETPTSGNLTVEATKTRGAAVAPFGATWVYETDGAGTLTSGRFVASDRVTPEQKADAELEAGILCELANGPATAGELRRDLACRHGRLTAALDRLESTGVVKWSGGPNRTKNYELCR